MALIGERIVGELEIRVTVVGPVSEALVPTLRLDFQIRNNYEEDITILPFQYDVMTQHPNLNKILGCSTVNTVFDGVYEATTIRKGGKYRFHSNFEIDYYKLGMLESMIDGDFNLSIRIFGTLLKSEDTGLKSYNFGTNIERIKIPISEWLKWMGRWIEERKILIISGSLWKKLYDLKQRLGLLDDETLLQELFDYYPYKINKRPA